MKLALIIFLATFAVNLAAGMYLVGVRDSVMITHSFKGEEFGAAQKLHGTTFTVDVDFSAPELVEKCNWVININDAAADVKDVLEQFHMKNLDECFPNDNTTGEFMCREVHRELCKRMKMRNFKGAIRVKM